MYCDVFMFSHVLSNPESRLSLYTYQFKCDSLRSAGLQVRGSRTGNVCGWGSEGVN